jgi:hypothetical protein
MLQKAAGAYIFLQQAEKSHGASVFFFLLEIQLSLSINKPTLLTLF